MAAEQNIWRGHFGYHPNFQIFGRVESVVVTGINGNPMAQRLATMVGDALPHTAIHYFFPGFVSRRAVWYYRVAE